MNATEARARLDRIEKMCTDSFPNRTPHRVWVYILPARGDDMPAFKLDLAEYTGSYGSPGLQLCSVRADTLEEAIDLLERRAIRELTLFAAELSIAVRKALDEAARDREGAK